MTELGPLKLTLVGHTKRFNSSIRTATTNLVKFRDTLKPISGALKSLAGVTKPAARSMMNLTNTTKQMAITSGRGIAAMKALAASMERQRAAAQKAIGPTVQVGIAWKQAGAAGLKGALTFRQATEQSFAGTIKSMLKFRAMMAKIIHYITFSIGVQMVMMFRRGFEQLIDIFSDFERAAVNATTISGYLSSSFERVKKHIMDVSRTLGRETVYSATQVADSFYSIASAGYDVSKMMANDLLPMLDYAAATQSDLTEATTAVLVTLKQFNMEMSETGHIVDVFTTAITNSFMTMEKMKESMKYAGPIAGVLGQSFESITAATSILVDRGLEAGQSGQRLNMVMVKLLKPTEKGRKSLEAMGYDMEDLTPLGNSLIDVLYRLQAGGAGATQMAEIFRARTAGAAAVLVEEAQAIARMTTRLEMAEGVTKAVADAQENTLWGALTKTANRMTEVATRVGEDLAPILIYMTEIIQKSLAPILEGLGGIFKFISKNALFFKSVLALLTTVLTFHIVRLKLLIPLTIALKNAQILVTLGIYKRMIIEKASIAVDFMKIAVTKGLTAATIAYDMTLKQLAITMLASPITWFAIAIGLAAFAISGMVSEATKLTEVEIKARKEMNSFQKSILDIDITPLEETTEQVEDMEDAWARHNKSIKRAEVAAQVVMKMKQAGDEYKDELDKIAQAAGFANAESVSWGKSTLEMYPALIDGIGEFAMSEMSVTKGILTRVTAQIHLNEALGKYEIALYLLDKANKQLVKAQEDFNSGTGDTLDLYAKLTKAEEKYADAQSELIKYTGKLLSAIRELPGYMEDFIQVLENAYDAKSGYITKTEHLIRLERSEVDALDDLTDAQLRYGSASKEAIRAEDKLRDAVQAKIDVEMESIELDKQYEQGIDLVQKAIDGQAVSLSDVEESMVTLNDAEQALLSHSMAIISMRESLTEAMTQEAIWSAKVAALDGVREDATKYLDERLLKLYETQDKIFDIEYKLYKLRQDEDDQLEGMFSSLAEQGLINDDIINQYKELMMAEGEVVKLNHEFAKVMGDLTPEQTAWVEQLMNAEKGSDEYNEALQNLQNSGVSGLDTIISMDDAQDHLASTIASLSGEMIPLIESLIEVGAVSSETAKMFYDFIDNMYELASGETKLATTSEDVADSFEGVMDVIAQLAMSLIDGEDGAEKLSDVFDELLDLLGLSEMGYDELNDILGTAYGSTEEFSDEELILAAALKKVASDLGIYQSGMSGASIATRLNLVATQDLDTAISTLMSKVGDAVGNLSTYKDAMNELAVATQNALAYLHGGTVVIDGIETEVLGLTGAAEALGQYLGETTFDFNVNGVGLEDLAPTTGDVTNYWGTVVQITKDATIDIGNEGDTAGDDWLTSFKNRMGELEGWIKDHIVNPIKSLVGGLFSSIQSGLSNIGAGRLPWQNEATGTIVKAQAGALLKGPQMVLAGEAGDEAIVPLEGKNRKYGQTILQEIIPKYFPELAMQRGGIIGSLKDIILPTELDNTQDLELSIRENLIKSEFPELDTQIIPIKQRLEEENIPDIESLIQTIRQKIVYEEIKSPEEVLQLIRQRLEQVDIPGIPDRKQVISQTLEETNIPIPEDKIQSITQILDEVEIPDIPDKTQYIEQLLSSFEPIKIPDMTSKIQYITDELPEYQKGAYITKGPQQAIIGENGAEAVIPLEGKNKKYGESILQQILPKYFGGVGMQTGGIVGGGTGELPTTGFSEILKLFAETTKQQLDKLISEFTFDQEDLEIDADEFNERVKDGSLSFKAIMLNIGQYMHSVFNKLFATFNDINNQFKQFISDLSKSTSTLSTTLSTFNTNMLSLISKISSITTSGGATTPGGGNNGGGGGSNDGSVEKETVASHRIEEKGGKYYGYATSTSGKEKGFGSNQTRSIVESYLTSNWPIGKEIGWAKGGIANKPTFGMFGEAGAEALIPLEGANKKLGKRILESIIPEYYPEMMQQTGGTFGGDSYNRNTTYGDTTSYNEDWNITGPVNITTQSPENMMEQLKYKFRSAGGK